MRQSDVISATLTTAVIKTQQGGLFCLWFGLILCQMTFVQLIWFGLQLVSRSGLPGLSGPSLFNTALMSKYTVVQLYLTELSFLEVLAARWVFSCGDVQPTVLSASWMFHIEGKIDILHYFPESNVISSNTFFCPTNSPKQKDSQFTII